jgi:metal-dependent HD superfamily phosphatase/phosphodiesterase
MEKIYQIKDEHITDIAIRITNMLIEKGLVMDCIEDNQEENEEKDMQDEIKAVLKESLQN